MTLRHQLMRLLQRERINFALTNLVPRRALTLCAGRLSKLRHPWISAPSIAIWRYFCDVDLADARKQRFESLHDCFTRELREGARPLDARADVLVSPCDAVIASIGRVHGDTALQCKGQSYSLAELFRDTALAAQFRGGTYVSLRLTAGMYHRFHAPHDCRVRQVNYFSGDTWNVNAPALRRVPRLYCRNERAVIRCELAGSAQPIALVPVAAILVASIRLHFLDTLLHLRYRGTAAFSCDLPLRKGEEMGWFEHGSTLLVFAPAGFEPCSGLAPGGLLRMGEPLLRLPAHGEVARGGARAPAALAR